MIAYAESLGYYTILDAAALAPTSTFSLKEHPVDAMAVSFYKMFGFPTGVGALIVKESFLAQLQRPWFAGGTVDVVQVPGTIMTRAHKLHEQFEVRGGICATIPAVCLTVLLYTGRHDQLLDFARDHRWPPVPLRLPSIPAPPALLSPSLFRRLPI